MIIDIIGISRHRGLEVLTTLYEFTDSQPMLLGHVLTSSASDGIPYKDYAIIDDSRWLFSAVIPNYDYRNRDMTRLQYFAVNLISPGNIADLIVDVQPIVTNRPSTIFTHCGVLRDKFIKPKKSP